MWKFKKIKPFVKNSPLSISLNALLEKFFLDIQYSKLLDTEVLFRHLNFLQLMKY